MPKLGYERGPNLPSKVGLSSAESKVYGYLGSVANDDGMAIITTKEITKIVKLSYRNTSTTLTLLVEQGLIKRIQGGFMVIAKDCL